jgi:hypothetical protein
MQRDPVPEAIVATLIAIGLVYPISPRMATIALFVSVPTLVLLLPRSWGDRGGGRRALRSAQEGGNGGSRGQLVTVVGLVAVASVLVLISYSRPSLALSVFIAFVGAAALSFNLLSRLYSIYSGSVSERAAIATAVLTTGLLLAAYYLGLGSLLGLLGPAFDVPEG